MLFHIEADQGTQIVGWLMPDNPSETPSVLVILPDGQEVEVAATLAKPDVIETLRDAFGFHHTTGNIGFLIDETILPGLAELQEFEIVSKDGRVPIYRRFQISRHLEKHFCCFDVAIMPQRGIQRALRDHFTLCYPQAQRYPMETLLALIGNRSATSVAITGRPSFTRHISSLRDKGYTVVALLRDPYEELAERLVFIKTLAQSKAGHLLPFFLSDFPDLIEFASDMPLADSKATTTKFRAATPSQREALMSPMTRLFACGIGEVPQHRHVSLALDNLASIDLVGVRSRFSDFRSVVAAMLERDVLGVAKLDVPSNVTEVCGMLSQLGIVSDLLEHDLNLYAHASAGVTIGLDGL
jgi:hypothetical protein